MKFAAVLVIVACSDSKPSAPARSATQPPVPATTVTCFATEESNPNRAVLRQTFDPARSVIIQELHRPDEHTISELAVKGEQFTVGITSPATSDMQKRGHEDMKKFRGKLVGPAWQWTGWTLEGETAEADTTRRIVMDISLTETGLETRMTIDGTPMRTGTMRKFDCKEFDGAVSAL
jgi:hypothetical protein